MHPPRAAACNSPVAPVSPWHVHESRDASNVTYATLRAGLPLGNWPVTMVIQCCVLFFLSILGLGMCSTSKSCLCFATLVSRARWLPRSPHRLSDVLVIG